MGTSVVAALLALDGTQITLGVLGAVPLTIAAVASLVSAWNSLQAKKELRPNGGSSARDDVTRRFDEQGKKLDAIAATVTVLMEEQVREKARAQYAEAELSARIEIVEDR